jgi:hypothetical protein
MKVVNSWFRSFFDRLFGYLFPMFMLVIEIVMRVGNGKSDATSLTGASLAAVGAAYVFPLVRKRPMTYEKLERLKQRMAQPVAASAQPVAAGTQPVAASAQSVAAGTQPSSIDEILRFHQIGGSITLPEEEIMRNVCLASILVLAVVWLWALWLSLHPSPAVVFWIIPIGILPGLINCCCGLLLVELREVVM